MAAVGDFKKKYGLGDMFTVRECYVCGKDFVVQDTGGYVYKTIDKNRLQYFCSWSCMQKFRRKKGLK